MLHRRRTMLPARVTSRRRSSWRCRRSSMRRRPAARPHDRQRRWRRTRDRCWSRRVEPQPPGGSWSSMESVRMCGRATAGRPRPDPDSRAACGPSSCRSLLRELAPRRDLRLRSSAVPTRAVRSADVSRWLQCSRTPPGPLDALTVPGGLRREKGHFGAVRTDGRVRHSGERPEASGGRVRRALAIRRAGRGPCGQDAGALSTRRGPAPRCARNVSRAGRAARVVGCRRSHSRPGAGGRAGR